jgi:hypothetical protein
MSKWKDKALIKDLQENSKDIESWPKWMREGLLPEIFRFENERGNPPRISPALGRPWRKKK